jgi:hypothetical protein
MHAGLARTDVDRERERELLLMQIASLLKTIVENSTYILTVKNYLAKTCSRKNKTKKKNL